MAEMIRLVNACKVYGTGDAAVFALKDVSLTVNEGEFVTVTGQSGAGKSTLLSCLGCLDTLSDGSYFLGGIDVATLSRRERARVRARKLGFVFQGFNLISDLTALENTELPLRYRGVPEKLRREAALTALREVGQPVLAPC